MTIHPLVVRICHWLNVLAVLVLVLSGWRIYNAAPVFESFRFPAELTLGGWLAGALQWHFAAMWLLFLNGLVYLALNGVTGRVPRRFLPLPGRGLAPDFTAPRHGRLSHDDLTVYNAVQKAGYVGAVVLLVLLVLSG